MELPPYNSPEQCEGLEQFSHLWLIFQFDKVPHGNGNPPFAPVLGGNQRVGVFASRATHRLNPLRVIKVELRQSGMWSWACFSAFGIRGYLSMVHLFLILNLILPMLITNLRAKSSLLQENHLQKLNVEFTESPKVRWKKISQNRPHLARFITEVIAQDPRPAYQQGKETDRIYGISLYEFNIKSAH